MILYEIFLFYELEARGVFKSSNCRDAWVAPLVRWISVCLLLRS